MALRMLLAFHNIAHIGKASTAALMKAWWAARRGPSMSRGLAPTMRATMGEAALITPMPKSSNGK